MLLLLDAGKRQQVLDQPGHAPPLLTHDGEEAVARLRVIVRRALQGLDEAEQRSERGAQLVTGVGDEVDAQPLDAPSLGLVAQGDERRHDFAVRRRERRDGDLEQPFDRHAFAPLHRLGLAARHHPAARVDDVGGAQAEHEGIADPQARQQIERRLVGRRRALVRADDNRRLRHRADELSRERRPHKLSEFLRLEALHRPAGQSSDGFDIASRSERQRRTASTPPSIAIAMRKGTA